MANHPLSRSPAPARSFCLSVSGAVAPSASGQNRISGAKPAIQPHPISPAGIIGCQKGATPAGRLSITGGRRPCPKRDRQDQKSRANRRLERLFW